MNRKMLRMLLTKCGVHQCAYAEDGAVAVEMVRSSIAAGGEGGVGDSGTYCCGSKGVNSYDILFVDNMMPNLVSIFIVFQYHTGFTFYKI